MRAFALSVLFVLLSAPALMLAARSDASDLSAAPSFSLPARDGTTVSLESLHGKVVLLDFWASWCAPCRQSFPWLESMYQQYSKQGLVVVGIDLDKSRGAAEDFLAKYPVSFTVAFDPGGKTAEAFRVRGMPFTYLLGPTGAILHSKIGFDPKNTEEFEAAIRKACSKT